VFDNLVKFVHKLGKHWQTRAWDPVFKIAGSAPDAAMILGLFSQKNLKINIDKYPSSPMPPHAIALKQLVYLVF
jgi:hypothetical protein